MKTRGLFYGVVFILILLLALANDVDANINSFGQTVSESISVSDEEIDEATKVKGLNSYGKLPLYFIQNNGQVDEEVKFYAKGSGHTTFFTQKGVHISLVIAQKMGSIPEVRLEAKGSKPEILTLELLKLTFIEANKDFEIIADGLQDAKVNFLIGNDSKKWRTNIPTYRSVVYKEVYKGIDVRFVGNNRQLEYDVIVKPWEDPTIVSFSYDGITDLKISEEGDLEIILEEGKLIQKKPYIYQEIDGKRVKVNGGFKLPNEKGKVKNAKCEEKNTGTANGQRFIYGFEVASYDKNHPLIIDPVLEYSTYIGGTTADDGLSIAVDSSGCSYITGYTESIDFPTVFPIQGTQAGHYDVFVTKIDASGNSLVYSTYLGGSGEDRGYGIAVDQSGNAYITGSTTSSDFSTTAGAYDTILNGQDAFIAKINVLGDNLVYSTYLGGSKSEYGYGIALDSSENAYITGVTWSDDFPTVSPIQGTFVGGNYDAFATKINAAGSSLVYSTFLGGNSIDVGSGIAVDPNGGAYITGLTLSSDFPTASPIFGTMMGDRDAFVTKIDASGSFFSYSTYLGGNDEDHGNGIAVDSSGNAYITGSTNSTDFPTVLAFQGSYGGSYDDAFVTKINPAGNSFVYSSFLGGGGGDRGYGIAVDADGNAYVTGWTDSSNFPTINPVQATFAGDTDIFVTKIDSSGSSLDYSTFLGGNDSDYGWGIAVDSSGNAYITGHTYSTDFPLQNPYQGSYAGSGDAFVSKISIFDPSFYWPVDSPVITQDYACYNCYKNNEKFHAGIDAYSSNYDPSDYDTPVKATSDGEIVCLYRTSDSETTWCDGSMDYFDEIPTRNRGFGNTVIIKHSDKHSLYGHLDCINREMVERFLKIEGKSLHVSNGEELGIMGNSSDQKRRSPKIGPHLHFEIKDRGVLGDPKYDKAFGYTKSLPPDRFGYNDPMLFFHPEIEDITSIPVRATDNVNILPGPGFYELKLNTLYLDQKIVTFRKAFNENGIWYQVYLAVPRRNPDIDRFSNVVEGWISGDFIEEDSVTKVRVKEGIKEPVLVYRKPGKGKIALVWSQQEFVVSTTMDGKGCQSTWYKVFLGNIRLEKEEIQQGWICGDFVDEVQ